MWFNLCQLVVKSVVFIDVSCPRGVEGEHDAQAYAVLGSQAVGTGQQLDVLVGHEHRLLTAHEAASNGNQQKQKRNEKEAT